MPARVLRVEARDVQLTLEMPLTFLKKLGKYLDLAVFEYDSTNPEHVEIYNFLTEELYPFVNGTLEGLENGNASDIE